MSRTPKHWKTQLPAAAFDDEDDSLDWDNAFQETEDLQGPRLKNRQDRRRERFRRRDD